MAEFLNAFIPTVALLLVPIAIPLFAVVVGGLRDALSGENRVESVEDRVRDLVASRDAAAPELAYEAA